MSSGGRSVQVVFTVMPDGRIQTQLRGMMSPAELVFAIEDLKIKLVKGEVGSRTGQLPSPEEIRRRIRGGE